MSHDHGHQTRSKKNKKSLKIVLVLTSAYMLAEVIGGVVTRSLALVADAGHMLTDVGGLALALTAIHFAEKKATPEKTYGYYRVEILAALANAVVLLAISAVVLFEAYQRFRNPPRVESGAMIAVAAVGLVVNVIGALVLKAGSSDSLNMKGAYFEVLSDLLTSIGVIVAGVIMLRTGWYLADPILSAGIGLFIVPRTWAILKEAVSVLLEGTPADVNLATVRETLRSAPGVTDTHDLHVWTPTSGVNALSAHVVVNTTTSHDTLLAALRSPLNEQFKIERITIQIEVQPCDMHEVHE